MDKLIIGFTGDIHQATTALVVKVIMEPFNTKPVNVESAKEAVTFLNVTLNKNNYTPINQTEQKSPCILWNMSHHIQ